MRIVSVSVGLVVASIGGIAFADSPPVQLESVTYNGSACPVGTADVNIAPDGTGFSMVFGGFGVGPGADVPAPRKVCQAVLHVAAAPGYTYAITGVQYGGYIDLVAGARASVRTFIYPQGRFGTAVSTPLAGPAYGWLDVENEYFDDELIWAPCDAPRALNVSTSVTVQKANDDDKYSAVVLTEAASYRLVWKECSN